jgi:DNA-binding GntR family transcriptional regulator
MANSSRVRPRGGDRGARLAEQIRNEILSGELQPGARILQEEIAARYGASRVPVREALSHLVHEGLITVVANAGAWVSKLTMRECEEVYQIREHLEPLLLRYSAPHLTGSDLQSLKDLAHEIEEASRLGDTEQFMQLDREFHFVSYSHARTLQLGGLITKLWNTTAPYRRAYIAKWSQESRTLANYEHHLMVAALRDQDIDEAERVLAGHIRRTRRQLSQHPELFGLSTSSESSRLFGDGVSD